MDKFNANISTFSTKLELCHISNIYVLYFGRWLPTDGRMAPQHKPRTAEEKAAVYSSNSHISQRVDTIL
jgi:hypothetical protein